jgi:hypothetical protein
MMSAYISVVIFVGNSEVVCLHGVPRDAVGCKVEDCPVERRACAEIIENNSAVGGTRGKDGCLDLVEGDMGDGVNGRGPHEVLHGCTRCAGSIVDGDNIGCRGEGGDRAVVRDGREGGVAVPGSLGRRLGGLRIRLEHLDLAIGTACNQPLVACPAHALDQVLVCLGLPLLLPAREVPNFDNTIATAAGKVLEGVGVLCEGVDTVNVAGRKVADERLRKHALDLGRIQGSRVLAGALKRVLGGVEVAGDFGNVGAGGLRRRRRPAEGFDLHGGHGDEVRCRCAATDFELLSSELFGRRGGARPMTARRGRRRRSHFVPGDPLSSAHSGRIFGQPTNFNSTTNNQLPTPDASKMKL